MTRMEPNHNDDSFDDFDTQIQSDELIPDGYEDGDWEPENSDPEFVKWEPYGNDADGYDGGDDFPW
jgi:hypothetical protein